MKLFLALLFALCPAVSLAATAQCHAGAGNCPLQWVRGNRSVTPPLTGGNTHATNNVVTVTATPTTHQYVNVYGAHSNNTTDVSGNRVNLSGGAAGYAWFNIAGAYASGTADANNNEVIVTNHSSTVNTISGGFARNMRGGIGSANNNRITIDDNSNHTVTQVFGGLGWEAHNNQVTIGSGQYGMVMGGVARETATHNQVTITGGHFTGIGAGIYDNIIGGGLFRGSGATTHNVISIKKGSGGNPSFGAGVGFLGGTNNADSTGNTLNMHTTDITVKNIGNFEKLRFYVQQDTPANATFLTLTDTADTDIRGTQIGVGIEGNNTLLSPGDKVVLIHKNDPTGTLLMDANLNNNTTGMQGISTLYNFRLARQDPQTLIAILSGGSGGDSGSTPAIRINPQTKSLSEARLASVDFVNRGLDLVENTCLRRLNTPRQVGNSHGFAAISGSASRTNTGSHIKVKGVHLVTGSCIDSVNSSGILTLGGFVEGGKGSYSSYNNFVDRPDVHAGGKTYYYGVGLLAKQQFNSDWFVEGGVRVGKSKMDYYSADLVDAAGNHTQFSGKSNYWGANINVGKAIQLDEINRLTPYAKLVYTHYDNNRKNIAGDTFNFSGIDSLRSRLGVRWQHQLNETSELYADAAWEHEFKGTAQGQVLGLTMPEPSLKGNTGIIDVGMNFTPNENLEIGVGVQGEFGKRSGVSATAKVKYSF